MPRYVPAVVGCLRSGYSAHRFLQDALAGLTVGVIALPLAMAFGIASIPESVAAELAARAPWLTPPAMGLYTAIVAGFLISALGGSHVQIGGPTGAFIVIVYGIAARHGYDGLATATLLAGVLVILMGLLRFGAVIKFIPYPVVTGFTSGIAVVIAAQQLRDLLGLRLHDDAGLPIAQPPEFVAKLQALALSIDTLDWSSVGVGPGTLGLIIVVRRLLPRAPWGVIAVASATAAVWLAGIPVETIGGKFGAIPRSLPAPHLPQIDFALIRELLPEAGTIAVLCAIESLLSAVVADGMTGRRHKSDCELVSQGAANIASALFFGIPATGAIARTVANIKSGGSTPIAGMLHAVTLVVFMLVAAPLMAHVPLPALAALLLMVAWNMSEIGHFRTILRTPASDVFVLLTTFALTVFTDLTLAVGFGVVMASLLFMKRLADVSSIQPLTRELDESDGDGALRSADPDTLSTRQVPAGVEVYEIEGPFFFGMADKLIDVLHGMERPPAVFILRMRNVPVIDATGLHALEEFVGKIRRQGSHLLLSGVQPAVRLALRRVGLERAVGRQNIVRNIDAALKSAQQQLDGRRGGAAPQISDAPQDP